MLLPVGILAVLSLVGGWIQFSPLWTPVTSWLEPAARTLGVAEPSNTQEAIVSVLAVLLGLAGVAVAWTVYARGAAFRRVPSLQRLFEQKFYFDEAYDALFYRPAAAVATWARSEFEEPVVLESGTDLGEVALEVGRGVRRLQTGLLRTYALFLGTGMAIVAVVFLLVK